MSSSTAGIQITTVPTFAAYLRFIMWAAFRQMRLLIPFAILGVTCFLLAPMIPFQQQGTFARYRAALGLLILPGILFVLLPLLTYANARKRWQSAAELREPRKYLFTETGLEIVADSFHSQVAWSHVITAHINRDQILLGTAQKQFYLVPTNDFQSQEQVAQFFELVRRHVPNCRL